MNSYFLSCCLKGALSPLPVPNISTGFKLLHAQPSNANSAPRRTKLPLLPKNTKHKIEMYFFICSFIHSFIHLLAVPGCREHTHAGRCFQMHSGRSCPLHRTADVPGAAHDHSGMPKRTDKHICFFQQR